MSDAIHRLFYSPSSPSSLLENWFATLVSAKKWPRMLQIVHFPNFFREEPLIPLLMEKGHYCVSVTTTTPRSALHYPYPCIHTSLQQHYSNGFAVFLQATTDELLPTLCKGSSTLFYTEKADTRNIKMCSLCLAYLISTCFKDV